MITKPNDHFKERNKHMEDVVMNRSKRTQLESWADRYNHTFELVRTVVQCFVFIAQLIILWKLFI